MNKFQTYITISLYNDEKMFLEVIKSLKEKEYYNIYTPYVELYHHESVSVGTPEIGSSRDFEEFREEVEMIKERWYKIIHNNLKLKNL